jgi:AraC family transcriptional regulator, ethanolamine operon transcriptional activator
MLIDLGQCQKQDSSYFYCIAICRLNVGHPVGWTGIAFDEYSDRIREAGALVSNTTPPTGHWDFVRHLLDRTILQFGSAGSGTIIHGMTHSDAYFLFMKSAKSAAPIVFDGRIVNWSEIVVVPPSSHFACASTGLAHWMSLSVPIELANGGTDRSCKKHLVPIANNKTLITAPAAQFLQFVDAAKMAHERLQIAQLKQKINLQAIESALLGMLDGILSDSVGARRCFNQRTEKAMAKVLECLRRDHQIHIPALLQNAGISERALHRAFQKYFHMGPKRYLKVRLLNLVRHAIRQKHDNGASVTRILTDYGVSEFGRFAIEYKALFGESPAETLQNCLEPRSGGPQMNYGT